MQFWIELCGLTLWSLDSVKMCNVIDEPMENLSF